MTEASMKASSKGGGTSKHFMGEALRKLNAEAASLNEARNFSTPPNSFVDPSFLSKFMEGKSKGRQSSSAEAGGDINPAFLNEALKRLSDADAETAPPTEEEMDRLFQDLKLDPSMPNGNSGGGGEDPGDLIEKMMRSLLSKEMLYPAIKELGRNYPDWLSENKAGLSEGEYEKFSEQNALVQRMCSEFEKAEDGQQEDFGRIMELMEQMQALGNPPKELTKGDDEGNVQLGAATANMMENCKMQ